MSISRSINTHSWHMNVSFSTSSKHHWLIFLMSPDASAISSVVFKFCPLNWIRCSLFSSKKVVWCKKIMELTRDNRKAALCGQAVHTKPLHDPLPRAKSWPTLPLHLPLQLAWLQWCLTKDKAVIPPTYEQYMLECLEILPISHNDFICDLSKTSTNYKNSIFYFLDKSRDIPTLGRCQFSPNLYTYSMQFQSKVNQGVLFFALFQVFFFSRNWQDVSKIFMESQRSKST